MKINYILLNVLEKAMNNLLNKNRRITGPETSPSKPHSHKPQQNEYSSQAEKFKPRNDIRDENGNPIFSDGEWLDKLIPKSDSAPPRAEKGSAPSAGTVGALLLL